MNMSWESRVDRVLKKEYMGWEFRERIYGKTADGKDFAIVISRVIWYAVRVIVEDIVVERHEFVFLSRAEEFCKRRCSNMERGI